nr:hypothetical protein Iba_chr09dCG13560 [Ipomoea batatas]
MLWLRDFILFFASGNESVCSKSRMLSDALLIRVCCILSLTVAYHSIVFIVDCDHKPFKGNAKHVIVTLPSEFVDGKPISKPMALLAERQVLRNDLHLVDEVDSQGEGDDTITNQPEEPMQLEVRRSTRTRRQKRNESFVYG